MTNRDKLEDFVKDINKIFKERLVNDFGVDAKGINDLLDIYDICDYIDCSNIECDKCFLGDKNLDKEYKPNLNHFQL